MKLYYNMTEAWRLFKNADPVANCAWFDPDPSDLSGPSPRIKSIAAWDENGEKPYLLTFTDDTTQQVDDEHATVYIGAPQAIESILMLAENETILTCVRVSHMFPDVNALEAAIALELAWNEVGDTNWEELLLEHAFFISGVPGVFNIEVWEDADSQIVRNDKCPNLNAKENPCQPIPLTP